MALALTLMQLLLLQVQSFTSVSAAEQLKLKGNIRVISMPCQEVYERQTLAYKNKCIPKNFDNILAVESGIGDSWHKFVEKRCNDINGVFWIIRYR